jgi:hypothetical protein
MLSLDSINRELLERYGRSNTGPPNFRIVFSDTQTEKRFGEFDVHFGKIFLRTEKAVREVPKYPYAKGRYILEKYVYAFPPSEVMDYNFYEPVFVFESASGQPLEPEMWAIDKLIHSLFYPDRRKLSDSQMKDDYDQQHQKIADRDVDVLENERPNSLVLSELGELVYVPSSYKEEKNGPRKS